MALYKTYIRPKLEYGCPIWSPHLVKDKKAIESAQRTFTKFACLRCGISFESYKHRLYQLNLKSLEYRRAEFDLIFLFKMVNGLCSLEFSSHFEWIRHGYGLRGNSLKIRPKFYYQNQLWDKCFFSRGPKWWNQLPESCVTATDLCSFWRELKKFNLNTILKTVFD